MKIDRDFSRLLPTISEQEKQLLRQSLKEDGQREPVVVWKQKGILLDGHNRHELLKDLGRKVKSTKISFPDRKSAEIWIITNQLSRRNLHQNHYAYYLGKKYEAEKGGPQNGDRRLSDKMARETGKGKNTIERNAAFAKGVDKLEEAKPGFKNTILNGATAMTKAMVTAIGKDDKVTPNQIRKTLKQEKRPEVAFKPKKVPFSEILDFIFALRWIDKANPDFPESTIVGRFFSDDPTGRYHVSKKTITKAVKLFSSMKVYERNS